MATNIKQITLSAEIKRLDEKIENLDKRLSSEIEMLREEIRFLREETKLAINIHERLAALEAKININK